MTPATKDRGGRAVQLTSDQQRAVQELRDYAQLYGDYFTTAAFNPSVAKWRDRPEDRERYLAGNTLRGRPWLSLNALKAAAPDGKWNTLREMAGLEANRPGPRVGAKRAAGTVAPIRDGESDRDRLRELRGAAAAGAREERARLRAAMSEGAPASAPAAPARDRALERELAVTRRGAASAATKLAKVSERLSAARVRARASDAAMRKQRDRADRNAELVTALRAELRDVGALMGEQTGAAQAGALAAAQANAEATRAMADAHAVREELTTTREELDRALELRDLADPAELERARVEVHAAREQVAAARTDRDAARSEREASRRAAAAAEREADRARREAASETRQRTEMQQALVGHDRPLSSAEVEELRGRGPSGSAVFLAAVKAVARANAKGQRQALREALRSVASAAIRWSDRL